MSSPSSHVEIEAKFRVASHEPIRRKLIDRGGTRLAAVVETNEIFDAADGSLRRRGCGLRLRAAADKATDALRATLTFKGPVQAGRFKSREEWEVVVDDAEVAAQILRGLGLVRVLRYRKRRESWRLGACRVELDEPPRLGLFVEIEGPDEGRIAAAADSLGLTRDAQERSSYVRLLHAYCVEQGVADFSLDLDRPDPGT